LLLVEEEGIAQEQQQAETSRNHRGDKEKKINGVVSIIEEKIII
jgi:hypothetical protein